jgi:hypothetical protein
MSEENVYILLRQSNWNHKRIYFAVSNLFSENTLLSLFDEELIEKYILESELKLSSFWQFH